MAWIVLGVLLLAAVSPAWIALRIAGTAMVLGGLGLIVPPKGFAEPPRWINDERVYASSWDEFLTTVSPASLIALALVPLIGVLIASSLRNDTREGPGWQWPLDVLLTAALGAIASILAFETILGFIPPNNASLLWHGVCLAGALAIAGVLWVAGRAPRIGGLAFLAVTLGLLVNSLILIPRQIMAEARAIAGDAPYCLAARPAMSITGAADLSHLAGWHAPLKPGWTHPGDYELAPLTLAVANEPREPISIGRNFGATLWGWDPATGSFVQRDERDPHYNSPLYTLNCIMTEDWLDQPQEAGTIEITTKTSELRVPALFNPELRVNKIILMASTPDFAPSGLIYQRGLDQTGTLEIWPNGAFLDWPHLTEEDLASFRPSEALPGLLEIPAQHPLREATSLPFQDNPSYIVVDDAGRAVQQMVCWEALCMHMIVLRHRDDKGRQNPVMVRSFFKLDQLENWRSRAENARTLVEPMIITSLDPIFPDD